MNRTAYIIALSLIIGSTLAGANPSQNTLNAADPQSPANRQLRDLQPGVLLDAGVQVVLAIDRAETRSLWRLASTAVAKKVASEDFIDGVVQQRAGLGTPAHRQWVDLNMQQVDVARNVPQGQYANCTFLTDFSGGRRVHELVTLHLDDDQVWRFAGYVVQ